MKDTFKARIEKLKSGDSTSRSVVLPNDSTIDDIKQAKIKLQNQMQAAISTADIDRDTVTTMLTVDVNQLFPVVIHTTIKF